MTIRQLQLHIKQQLSSTYDEGESDAIARSLASHLLNLDHNSLLSASEKEVDSSTINRLPGMIDRLIANEPLQYVISECWFLGLKLFIDNRVLIPRPETEELVNWVSHYIKTNYNGLETRSRHEADHTKEMKILDVGTGSGCIALALKKNFPSAEVWGCDKSDDALNLARANGAALDIRVDFQSVDFLNPSQQKHLPTVHIIVSNPPYIPASEAGTLHPNVVNHEPHLALFVPDNDPLVFYQALSEFGQKRLYEDGSIFMEVHESLGAGVSDLFAKHGYKTETKKDMQGKDRMIRAWR